MSKVIAIMNKPESCEHCTFLMQSHITKQKTRKYCCNLKDGNKIAKERIYEEFGCNEEVHLSNCPLHEIENIEGVNMYNVGYNKAIDDFAERIKQDDVIDYMGSHVSYEAISQFIDEIAEQLKDGGKNE